MRLYSNLSRSYTSLLIDCTNFPCLAGINSFKFFLAYKGALIINDELLLEGLKKCKSVGALAMVHAENGDAVFEGQKRMIELDITGPEGHALSRPPLVIFLSTNRRPLLILSMWVFPLFPCLYYLFQRSCIVLAHKTIACGLYSLKWLLCCTWAYFLSLRLSFSSEICFNFGNTGRRLWLF